MNMFDKQIIKLMLTSDIDPLKIAGGKTRYGETDIANQKSVYNLLKLGDLYGFLHRDLNIIAVLAILVCLISLLFVHKADMVADKKKDIEHKLLIVFIGASLITLLNLLTSFLGSLF